MRSPAWIDSTRLRLVITVLCLGVFVVVCALGAVATEHGSGNHGSSVDELLSRYALLLFLAVGAVVLRGGGFAPLTWAPQFLKPVATSSLAAHHLRRQTFKRSVCLQR